MKEPEFRMIETNGVTLRTVVEGDGPLVILLHGWPQCWYLWRNQIAPLAAAGYTVAVPDQRGYGGSSKPAAVRDYGIRKLADDVAGLCRALGFDEFNLVGHDWGCLVAWNTALLHEDSCKSVMGLSVPFWRWDDAGLNPAGYDDRFWYARHFQAEGVIEAELEADIRQSLLQIYAGLTGNGAWLRQLEYPRSAGLLETMPQTSALSPGFTEQDMDYYVQQYQVSGFRGPCNWYRNVPFLRTDTPESEGKKFSQPAAFVAGSIDDVLLYDPNWRDWFPGHFEDLRFIEIIEGSGHWLQCDNPQAVTAQMLRFLGEVEPV
ncbi:MAG: alpha/beta hydrolase [Gammaproteobacteria bacterium]|nr:alpha/beta hydrolase [Gammaproteobacteria bacterium]